MSAKTVFISYRRDATGKAFARSIKQELTRHGYDVFFDVDSIDAGKWADQILTEVPKRSHFLLLLTPRALERCVDEDDWVRREFETAVNSGRNIVPVREESVDLAKLQRGCSVSMKGLFDFQVATLRQDGFEDDIENLIDRYIPPHKAPQSLNYETTTMVSLPTIVLLTVNENETGAVLDVFAGEGHAPPQRTIGGVTYNLLGTHGGMALVHTIGEMGAGGVGASQQRTRDAVDHWKPAAVIGVGIAFGLDETRQNIGDVLVATQIQDYDLGRINKDGTVTPRGDKPHTSDILCNRLRQTDATQTRIANDWPRLRFGLLLSGQKLVDNLDYRESLKTLHPESIGGEMEATGLYVSATSAKIDWILVKAICDWGHNKNQADKDAWQNLAAGNAARVLKAAVDVGSLYSGTQVSATSSGTLPPRSPDKYLRERHPVIADSGDESRVIGIEFVADGPLGEFDEESWQAALRELVGQDISKVRIASIRKGSTVVKVLGDPEVIAKALEKLKGSPEFSREFQSSTGFRSYSGVLTSKAAEHIFGRSEELSLLDLAWEEKRTNVLSIIGFGGIGKSYLIAYWTARLAADGWRGAERIFEWSFYSQGIREHGAVSADTFIASALVFFGDTALARSTASPWEKGLRLAQLIAQQRTLVVLDGLEPMQHPPGPLSGQLKDPAMAALLRSLAQHNPGLCIVTTRVRVADLVSFQDSTAPELELQHLSTSAGVELLKTLGVRGSEEEFQTLVEDVKGHALTLNVLGHYLARAHQGDIRKRDTIDFHKTDAKTPAGHAFKAIEAYEKWLSHTGEEGIRQVAILRLLGLFDRPVDLELLAVLQSGPVIPGLNDPLVSLSPTDRELALVSLAESGLIMLKRSQSFVDAHPLIREYFAKQLREKNLPAWRSAHRRLFEHLKDSTTERPDTLESLQPLYQAVAHGCQADLSQEAFDKVYLSRILRGSEFYSWRKLGLFGSDLEATACFFERPWSRLARGLSGYAQAFLLNASGLYLRAVGRLAESVEPMQAGVELASKLADWVSAAVGAGNLAELELTLGQIDGAIRSAEESLAFTERSGDGFMKVVAHTLLADALHQAGLDDNALTHFRQAEALQVTTQPNRPLLYSVQGFRFCDFLLGETQRCAWQLILGVAAELRVSELKGVPAEVEQRARETLKLAETQFGLLSNAIDHLTLGRAALYASILESPSSQPTTATSHITAALEGLRRAGTQDYLPRGLLTRALLRFITGPPTGPGSAREDLDEAWEIAERGPMKLFMADIHLYRARLFHAVTPYPWATDAEGNSRGPKDDLAAARKLIEQCGYWRRKEELEDAEEAAKNW